MKLPIPERVLEQHVIALGKTGAGKSSKMRVLIEHLLRKRERVTIIDIKGDWWGLKASADGKSSGFPMVIFGGKHADVPLLPGSGRAVAELLNTADFPALVDLRGWRPGERAKWYIDFMDATFEKTEGKRYIMISEVHNFAPKGKVLSPQAGEMLHWSNRLASEGRGYGITFLADSQRPQKVHNDLLTSVETLIACKVIHKADREAIEDWIDGCADSAVGKQVIRELAGMKKPDSWVWCPEVDFGPQPVQWPLFSTFDSFKPQEATSIGKLKGWAEIDLDQVKSRLSRVIDEAKANDPAELKRQIADLRKQLSDKRPSQAEIDKARDLGMRHARALTAKENRALIEAVRKSFSAARDVFSTAFLNALADLRVSDPEPEFSDPAVLARMRQGHASPGATAAQPPARPRTNGAGEPLPRGEAATLAACIQYPDGLRREQLTVLTGYKRSSRDAYIQRLRERGYVETRGDLIVATADGQAAMPDAEPLPTGEDLQNYWLTRLPEGEKKILEVLIGAYPDPVDRNALDERTGYKRSSRDAYIQRLSAKQLVVEPARGSVKATETLFG